MKKILILGDSQVTLSCTPAKACPTTGAALDRLLTAEGHAVTRKGYGGKTTAFIYKQAKKALNRQWDEVYIIAGGNDVPAMPSAVADLLLYFEPSGRVFYIPLPPATIATGRKTNKDFLFPKTAAFREKKNALYKKVANDLGFPTVLDFRDAPMSDAVTQPSGVIYPSQYDGYHTRRKSAEEMAAYIMEKRKSTVGGVGLVVLSALAAGALAFFLVRRG